MTARNTRGQFARPEPLWNSSFLRHVNYWVNVYPADARYSRCVGGQHNDRWSARDEAASDKPLYRVKVKPKARAQTLNTFILGRYGDD